MSKDEKIKRTVYLPEQVDERFVREAESKFRSMSDHMTAILAERYGLAPAGVSNGHGKEEKVSP